MSGARKGWAAGSLNAAPKGGLRGWLLRRLGAAAPPRPELEVVERIALAPRQWLTLVEASGERLLIAASADGPPAIYPVGAGRTAQGVKALPECGRRRVS